MRRERVNLVTADAHSPSLEGGKGSGMARNSISTAGMLCSPALGILPLSAKKLRPGGIKKGCGLPDPCRIKPGFQWEDRRTQSRFMLGMRGGLLAAQCCKPAVL